MINLIPNQEKKRRARELYYRLAVLSLLMFSFALLVASLAILPAYFFAVSKSRAAQERLEIQRTVPISLFNQEALKTLETLNRKIVLVEEAAARNFPVSERVITPILAEKLSGIKLSRISYENSPAGGKKISLGGTAASRESLLLFRQALEDSPSFESVDLPISNFIKDSNIEFSLSLIPKDEK
jgi:hypothetical protein